MTKRNIYDAFWLGHYPYKTLNFWVVGWFLDVFGVAQGALFFLFKEFAQLRLPVKALSVAVDGFKEVLPFLRVFAAQGVQAALEFLALAKLACDEGFPLPLIPRPADPGFGFFEVAKEQQKYCPSAKVNAGLFVLKFVPVWLASSGRERATCFPSAGPR